MSLRSAYRRLRRWHQDRRAARAFDRLVDVWWLLRIELMQDRAEEERGWK